MFGLRNGAMSGGHMARSFVAKTLLYILIAVAVTGSGALLLSEYALRRAYPLLPETARAAGPDTIAEGRRLAKLYGCTSCHGLALQGLLYNDDPALVRNYAPNLTRLAATYSDGQMVQAIKQGVSPADGRALWGMPSATFRTITDREMGALLAFLRSFPPAGRPTPGDSPGIAARIALLRGMLLPDGGRSADPARAGTQQPAPVLVAAAARHPPRDPGPAHKKGRHLAMTICGECHGSDLGGDVVEGGPDLIVAGAYDAAAFRRLMRTGVAIGERDLGLMSAVARDDLTVFTDEEIAALHAYLVARANAGG